MNYNKIKPLLSSFALFLSVNMFAQQQSVSNAVQITTQFDQEQNQVLFMAENQDFCDYTVYISLGGQSQYRKARPGKTELFRVKYTPDMSFSGYRFAMYRGNADKKPNIDFAYCLPIAKGDSTVMFTNPISDGYQMSFIILSDTLYASRGGIVCDDELTDFTAKGHQNFSGSRIAKKITIYHDDGTFGEYVFMGQPLTSLGKRVSMGQPVAVLNKSNEDIRSYSNFAVYFLDKNKVRNTSTGNKHTHFRPFFQTVNDGKVRLEEEKTYICDLNDEMLMQDMSKQQRKKFQKVKNKK